ncbi:hypothetical protein DSO57_1024940 [Entomophthora muscae]|uniref:Uncharacterized protein n=1 Tax=Entomophthora muscae TaxID=34485 RepID=A0ACC2UNB9_9FUNG|nr:hypothetical protein DSO57_1024940 [Entomophthora muscae]
MYTKTTQDSDSTKLKEFISQSRIQYLQTLGQHPVLVNVSLFKPTIFTYINGSIDNESQKQLLTMLKVPFKNIQKHVQEEASDALLLLVDSSAHQYYYLNPTGQENLSIESVSSSIQDFQQSKLEAHPLIEDQKGVSYIFYVLAGVLLVGVLGWYIKKAKKEPEIHYSRL